MHKLEHRGIGRWLETQHKTPVVQAGRSNVAAYHTLLVPADSYSVYPSFYTVNSEGTKATKVVVGALKVFVKVCNIVQQLVHNKVTVCNKEVLDVLHHLGNCQKVFL